MPGRSPIVYIVAPFCVDCISHCACFPSFGVISLYGMEYVALLVHLNASLFLHLSRLQQICGSYIHVTIVVSAPVSSSDKLTSFLIVHCTHCKHSSWGPPPPPPIRNDPKESHCLRIGTSLFVLRSKSGQQREGMETKSMKERQSEKDEKYIRTYRD